MSASSPPRIRGRISPCRSCGHDVGYLTPSKAMHAAGVRCDYCDRFIKWLPKAFFERLTLPQDDSHERA